MIERLLILPLPMLLFVIALNCLLAMVNFYLAWKLWQWRGAIAIFIHTLDQLEGQCHRLLTAQALVQEQRNLQSLRQDYQRLTVKLLRLQQILFLLSWLTRSRWKSPIF